MNSKLFSVFSFVVVFTTIYLYRESFIINIKSRAISKQNGFRIFFNPVNSSLPRPLMVRSSKRFVIDVNCEAIIKGDADEIKKAEDKMNSKNFSRKGITDKMYIDITRDCDNFKRNRYYPDIYSDEEIGFPIAYSILLYKDVEQAERLLRAIYSPQNYYCIHVDGDAERDVHDAIDGIANCLENVFAASPKEYVVYAGFTRLQADLTCMKNLLQRGKEWKYFINLPSQEFPLKTNAEIATILRIYNGSNDIEGLTGNRRLMHRYKHRFVYRYDKNRVKPNIEKTNQTMYGPPYDIEVVKGSAYGIFSRDFVHFVTFDKKARAILDWFRDVLSPDEYYWATLNYNHHIGTPGSYYIGKPDTKPWLAVFANWGEEKCHGTRVRGICIFGVGDLHKLVAKPSLFANKFFIDYQPYALDCIEEWHYNRSTQGIKYLNTTYYKSLPFIKHETNNSTF